LYQKPAEAESFKETVCFSGCFALDALRRKTYAIALRMVKSAGSASARKSEMNIFRLFYSLCADAVDAIL
jgi:hypothetical protein